VSSFLKVTEGGSEEDLFHHYRPDRGGKKKRKKEWLKSIIYLGPRGRKKRKGKGRCQFTLTCGNARKKKKGGRKNRAMSFLFSKGRKEIFSNSHSRQGKKERGQAKTFLI